MLVCTFSTLSTDVFECLFENLSPVYLGISQCILSTFYKVFSNADEVKIDGLKKTEYD